MSLAWPKNGIAGLLFISFIPFVFVESYILNHKEKFSKFAVFFYVYVGFLVWNLLTTWWIYYASLFGAIMAVLLNSLLMSIVFQLFHYCRKILNRQHIHAHESGYFILIVFWIGFEFFHLSWELSWPWLQLGNGFATSIKSIQWYEFTGVMGGTLWILTLNIMIFRLLLNFSNKTRKIQSLKYSLFIMAVLIIPLITSWIMYYSYEETSNPVNVVVIQPNVDPYGEKFVPEFREEIWNKLLGQSVTKATKETDFILWPETSIPGTVSLHQPDEPMSITRIKDSLKTLFPQTVVITGADCYEVYNEPKTATARYFRDGECCWDSYNSALEIDSSGLTSFYHKSKLVPGVERMPYPQIFRFLEKFAVDLGGTTGSLGTSEEPVVFSSGKVPVAPVICYESVYGEYVSKYITKGAQLIFIITNDGWWGDTPGYRQHFTYASLRAIENRRCIARSANTGISGYINQRGDIIESVPFWEQHALSQTINANDKLTIFTRYGDYIGRISIFASLAIILLTFVKRFSGKKLL